MSNYYASCFYRIDFVVIPSYRELPCFPSRQFLRTSKHHVNYIITHIIASTQITNTEIFAFIAILIFKLLNRKVLFINKKDNRNYQKVGYFLRKQQILRVIFYRIINTWNPNFQDTFETHKRSFISAFSICITVTLNPNR